MGAAQAQAPVTKHQPRVAQVVSGHSQSDIAIGRVDIFSPHSGWLKEMGVRVNDRASLSLLPEAGDGLGNGRYETSAETASKASALEAYP